MEGTTSTTVAHYVDGAPCFMDNTWIPQVPAPWTTYPTYPTVPPSTTHYINWDSEDIRLTMAEVAALQRAAEADEEVRSVLNKIAKRIKVDVEF